MNKHSDYSKKFRIAGIFCVAFLSLLPLFVLSLIIVSLEFRDNANYIRAFNSININAKFTNNYTSYAYFTGAIEPLLFLYYYLTKTFTDSYILATAIKNFCFLLQVSYIINNVFKNNNTLYLFLIYLSTDFYILRMMAELHRLHLSIIFIIPVLFLNKKLFFRTILSLLSHAQAFIYFLFLKFRVKSVFLLFPVFVILLTSQYEYILNKISYYQTLSVRGALKVTSYSIFFMAIIEKWSISNFIKFGLSYFIIAIISLFIGEERLFFIVVESSIIFGFYRIINIGMTWRQAMLFSAFVLMISLYNLSRVFQFMQEALYSS